MKNEMIKTTIENITTQIADLTQAIERSKRTLRGNNSIVVIKSESGSMFMKFDTDSTGLVTAVYPMGNPLKASHLTPVDAKNIVADDNIKNGHGDAAEVITWVSAYKLALAELQDDLEYWAELNDKIEAQA